MKIQHRGIYEDRFDTPVGMGTMIFALDCRGNCPGCFHQDKRSLPIYEEDADDILDKIVTNPFCKCLVLGGYEFLDYQYEESLYLIEGAQKRGLDVILYTRRYVEELRRDYPQLFAYKGLYIKCGPYDENNLSPTYTSMGVPLASTNQYIIQVV